MSEPLTAADLLAAAAIVQCSGKPCAETLSARMFDAAAEAWADEKAHGRDTEHDDETEQ